MSVIKCRRLGCVSCKNSLSSFSRCMLLVPSATVVGARTCTLRLYCVRRELCVERLGSFRTIYRLGPVSRRARAEASTGRGDRPTAKLPAPRARTLYCTIVYRFDLHTHTHIRLHRDCTPQQYAVCSLRARVRAGTPRPGQGYN